MFYSKARLTHIFWLTFIFIGFQSIIYAQTDSLSKRATVAAPLSVTPSDIRFNPMPQADIDQREDNINNHHLPGPLESVPQAEVLAATPPTMGQTSILSSPRANQFLLNHGLTDTETNNSTSPVNEPSVATRGQEVLYTANWFSAFSTDGGNTFSFRNPGTTFPSISGQPFCCDQLALYNPEHDLMIWFLQYVTDASGNTIRIAVAQGGDIPTESWRYYDFTPTSVGGWNNEWFDYPEMAFGDDFLYITTNTFTTGSNPTFTRAVTLRLPLADMASYSGLSYDYFDVSNVFSLRPTHGSTSTMYLGTHVNNNTLRIFSWPESSATYSTTDVSVDVWSAAGKVAPGPDGGNWIGRSDSRITGSYETGGEIGFAWTAAQDANFAFPQVRVAIIDKATMTVSAQPHIWHTDFAYAYPALSPNNNGDVGISVSYGGGSIAPSHAVGSLIRSVPSWDMTTTAVGTNDPDRNVWGDYQAVRPHPTNNDSWVASGFTLDGGRQRDFIVPRYIIFQNTGGYSISLENPDPNRSLNQGESMNLNVQVTLNGLPAPGETVNLSSDNNSWATVVPTVTTDANGRATATVTGQLSNGSETATITASTNGTSDTAPVKVPDMSLVSFLLLVVGLIIINSMKKRRIITN